eukprot:13451531-Alexandrium_andersonii.AAC.1
MAEPFQTLAWLAAHPDCLTRAGRSLEVRAVGGSRTARHLNRECMQIPFVASEVSALQAQVAMPGHLVGIARLRFAGVYSGMETLPAHVREQLCFWQCTPSSRRASAYSAFVMFDVAAVVPLVDQPLQVFWG